MNKLMCDDKTHNNNTKPTSHMGQIKCQLLQKYTEKRDFSKRVMFVRYSSVHHSLSST